MDKRLNLVIAACVLAALFVSCAPRAKRFPWDMERYYRGSDVRRLRRDRVIVRGLTERQVRSIWGNPQDRVEMPPSYSSLTYETRMGWITVVFENGRVTRVEDFTDPEGTAETD